MNKMKIAMATDDGENFIDRHFGDANMYKIYKLRPDEVKYIKTIENTVDEEEKIHADPKKAKGIANLLKEEGVQLVASRAFGPNIKRIRKKFVCIVIGEYNLENGLDLIQKNFDAIVAEWNKGKDRKHLVLGKE
jgi:predicted Fe-Mo cluster-binding NifX family protein